MISPSETRTRIEAQHLGACKDAECFGKVATSFGADGVVAVQVEETGKRYGVQVHLYDAAGREVGKVVTEFCDICTVREATETVEKAVRQALSKASFVPPPPPAPIKPPPSTVTPPDDAEEGPNALRSSAAEKRVIDEARQQRPPRTPGSSENEVPPRVTLGESRDAPPAPRREIVEPADKGDGHFPYRPLAGAAFGVAGVALIVTVVFSVYHLKYDNQPTCTLADPKRNCPEVYSGNTAPAAVMGVLTVLSAGTGALLLYLDSRSRHHATAMLVPTPDGFAASASFQF